MIQIKSKITKSQLNVLYEECRIKLDKINKLPLITQSFGGIRYNIDDKIYFVPHITHSNFDENNEVHVLQRKILDEEVFELISDEEFKIYNRNQKLNSL